MGGLRELLRECEKGVLRAARPRTPFQGEYPTGDVCYIFFIDLTSAILFVLVPAIRQPMADAQSISFLSVPAVTTSTRMYAIYSLLISLVLYICACSSYTTTYGRCTEYFIFVCASCDNLNQDVCYIFSIDLTSVIFLLMPAVPTYAGCTQCYC